MNQRRVFVTGMGVISPLGLDVQSTWQSLIKGQSGVDSISSFDAEGFETRIAAEVKGFDPLDYLERKEARRLDRFAQFACAVTLQAIHEAELQLDTLDRERVATLIGSGIGGIITLSQQFQALLEKGSRWVSPFLVPMMLSDMGSGQVSMMLGVKGPNFCTVSSCSSGADAMGEAWEMLRRGDVDVALAGGSEAPICPIAIAGFGSMRALSRRNEEPQKASRPFDAQRDGFVMGEGAAVLVLESEESVVRRGARPLVELVGYGASSDAHHVTEPAPGGEGSARAMKLALRKAGLEPRDIDYVNAHGTSTVYNDKFETMAIKTALGEEAHRIPVSSTKSMHGHLLGAGGALEAAICIQAILTDTIPPTINLDHPDRECDLDYTPHQPRQTPVHRAISNSFGFGGHNSVLVFSQVDGSL